MSTQAFNETSPRNVTTIFNAGIGTGPQNIWGQQPNNGSLDRVLASNNDVIPHVLVLSVNLGGAEAFIGSATVPAGAGYGGTPSVDVLALAQPGTAPNIAVDPTGYFRAYLEVAMGGASVLTTAALGGYL